MASFGLIGMEYLIGSAIINVILILLGLFRVSNDWSFNPERKQFIDARKNSYPLLSVEDAGTARARWITGYKDKDGSPIFEDATFGLKIDPSFISGDAEPTHYPLGLDVWHTSVSRSLPISTRAAIAYQTMAAHRNDRPSFGRLSFLPNVDLWSHLRQKREDLEHNAELIVKAYKPTFYDPEARRDFELPKEVIVDTLKDMQEYLMKLPLDSGTEIEVEEPAIPQKQQRRSIIDVLLGKPIAPPLAEPGKKKRTVKAIMFTYYKAFKDLPYSHCSQDTERIKYLIEAINWRKLQDQIKMFTYVIAFCMIIGVLILAFYVLANMVFK
ncbi:MAG: hypothetical protein WC683_11840 [bacterium]